MADITDIIDIIIIIISIVFIISIIVSVSINGLAVMFPVAFVSEEGDGCGGSVQVAHLPQPELLSGGGGGGSGSGGGGGKGSFMWWRKTKNCEDLGVVSCVG